jgi:hypothetical protein
VSLDAQVRLQAFGWLRDRIAEHGEVLPRAILAEGFVFEGVRVPLLGPQGIFKPRLCDLPLSITTSPNGPYSDMAGADGLIEYRALEAERRLGRPTITTILSLRAGRSETGCLSHVEL